MHDQIKTRQWIRNRRLFLCRLFQEALETVTIDLTKAHIWDISSVAALDTVILKFQREGAEVKLVGLNKASETIVDELAVYDKSGGLKRLIS